MELPLERFPDTYIRQPLSYVGLAAPKWCYSLYLNAVYAGSAKKVEFQRRWEATGRKLDMGKSCVRFKKLDDLGLALVSEVAASKSVDESWSPCGSTPVARRHVREDPFPAHRRQCWVARTHAGS